MRNIFVVSISSFGLFLISYRPEGEEWKKDRVASLIAGVSAILVAFFPTSIEEVCGRVFDDKTVEFYGKTNFVHIASALVFFITITYMCVGLFTKSNSEKGNKKRIRNNIYYSCGGIMMLSVMFLLLFAINDFKHIIETNFKWFPYVFFFETISILAFGIAWLVKGEGIKRLNDK